MKSFRKTQRKFRKTSRKHRRTHRRGGLKMVDIKGAPWTWKKNRMARKEAEQKANTLPFGYSSTRTVIENDDEDELPFGYSSTPTVIENDDEEEEEEKEDDDYDPNETDMSRYIRENGEEYGGRRRRHKKRGTKSHSSKRHRKTHRKSRKY